MKLAPFQEEGAARHAACIEPSPGPVIVEPLTPATEAAWDAFVSSCPNGSHYHRAGWARVIRRAFGQKPLYRMAISNGKIVGVLPVVAFANPFWGRYLVSVPYLNRGGILAATSGAREALLSEAERLLEETRSAFFELRHVERIDPSLPSRDTKVSMSLALQRDPEELWKNLGGKVCNLVRKTEKHGLTVREGDPDRDLLRFYDVFSRNMRELGTPVYHLRFFRELFREFGENLRLTIVEKDGLTCASGICVTHGQSTEIHWAAARSEYLPFAPNMALYWEAISHAARSGLKEFCFGRSTEDSGPYRFKKQWGAEPTRLAWEYVLPPGGVIPGMNPENPKFRMAVKIWKKLPLFLTRSLGPRIVRHLP